MASEIRKTAKPSEKEEQILDIFWARGPLFVKEVQGLLPEPRPHVNTLSTLVRLLESNGFLSHKPYGNTYQYFPLVSREQYGKNTLSGVIDSCFGNSYLRAVSTLVQEEKISVEELRQLIEQIENQDKR